MNSAQERIGFIWSIAELLRGDYKEGEYGRVILPFTVLRRLDCVLASTKSAVLAKAAKIEGTKLENNEAVLNKVSCLPFHNASALDFERLKGDSVNLARTLRSYVRGFSSRAREVLDRFGIEEQIARLDEKNLLFQVYLRFAAIDLHPDNVSNLEMGHVFEELIRRFSEQSNETAGEHFTPREVIRLMVHLLFAHDRDFLATPGSIRTLFDPACGTGGMLSVADDYVAEHGAPGVRLEVFGQELNDESFAICCSDMMMKGYNPENIRFGNSFSKDGFPTQRFDYMLSNPPFGVDWKKVEDAIRAEHDTRGHAGRFGAGLPRINDGSFLFLQHMISKMKPEGEGSRLAIVFNGSPLFTGDAGSGESEIRRWIVENDWLEAIVALPDQLFYNTGISTYIWVLTNRKPKKRKGKIQLVNAVTFFGKMRKSLGQKRNEISEAQIGEITRIYGDGKPGEFSKIFDNDDFGNRRITVERPLRLNFEATSHRIARLPEKSAYLNLARSKKKGKEGQREIEEGQRHQKAVLAVLESLAGLGLIRDRAVFLNHLDSAANAAGIKLAAPLRKAIVEALGDRDESAEICHDSEGNPEPDPELRDYENVPHKEKVEDYFAREVLPHVPDAWIDHEKTKIGYEIPFTRHFYVYQPPRHLKDIEEEIRQIDAEIQGLMGEVFA